MAANRGLSKKRKPELDLDSEKTLYGAFTQAASAVSTLYTLASQQQRKSRDAGAKQALERVASWVFSQYAGSAVVPTAALLEFLRQEMQDCTGGDTDFSVGFAPTSVLPVPPGGLEMLGSDENMLGENMNPSLRRGSCGGMQVSPPKRGSSQSLVHQPLYIMQQQLQQQQQQQQAQQALESQAQHCQGFFPGS
ncbi:hypothetical protein N2152v2_009519 [Parachlorella kessleri]